MTKRCTLSTLVILVAALYATPQHAQGELQFDEGHWRMELATTYGIHSGTKNRSGNTLVTGTVEYEFPTSARTTLALRLMPLFLYDQRADKGDAHFFDFEREDNSDDTVWGAGFGLVGRIYHKKDTYRGWFAEAEGLAVGHTGEVRGNSSNLNFLIGVGLGYKFQNNWHTVLKYEHISNAGIGDRNAGANGIGLGIGYSF